MATRAQKVEPYVSADKHIPEFTWLAVGLGIILSVVLGAANVYLGLYAGMTVSASIPAAVISMVVLRGLLKRGNILENNIVQTIASAGESLAAGIIFTVPALVLVGTWKNFEFWPTTLIALCGGLLGVVFMIPLRRALIVEEKELTYPEGMACAEVLIAGETGGEGGKVVLQGVAIGGVLKLLIEGLGVIKGKLAMAFTAGSHVLSVGSYVSPALIGVGYIVNIQVAALVFLGGAIAFFVAIPLLGVPAELLDQDPWSIAMTLWSTKVRYMGVGAMLVGGIWSLFSVRRGIAMGVSSLKGSGVKAKDVPRTDRDLHMKPMFVIFLLNLFGLLGLYHFLLQDMGLTLVTTGIMVVASFLFVAVSSYIVGLVGSSNNPVSGMTICALLGTGGLLLVLGMVGDSAIVATLGVAGVVCCAACAAGDCSQDLKTGYIVGATPRKQQIAEMIGVVAASAIMAPILTMLHSQYVIGSEKLAAPQATLFASIAKAMFADAPLETTMVLWGVVIGVMLIVINEMLKKSGSSFRTHVMPVAVGIYLPITLSVPILIGGLLRAGVDSAYFKRHKKYPQGDEPGVLACSGLIAGEAIMGVIWAAVAFFGYAESAAMHVDSGVATTLAVVAMLGLIWFIRSRSLKGNQS